MSVQLGSKPQTTHLPLRNPALTTENIWSWKYWLIQQILWIMFTYESRFFFWLQSEGGHKLSHEAWQKETQGWGFYSFWKCDWLPHHTSACMDGCTHLLLSRPRCFAVFTKECLQLFCSQVGTEHRLHKKKQSDKTATWLLCPHKHPHNFIAVPLVFSCTQFKP